MAHGFAITARARSICKSSSNNPRWQRWLGRIMITMMMPTWSSNERRDGEQKKSAITKGANRRAAA